MQMPGRVSSSGSYRYGFNGQENSAEVTPGNYTAEYWEYDSRVARRWNIDPVINFSESPFAVFSNNPILLSDPLGAVPGKPKKDGTSEGEKQTTSETTHNTLHNGARTKTETWFWHAGSADYNTKAGWYNSAGYQNVLAPIGRDLAGYQGLLSTAASVSTPNWNSDEVENVANTNLGRFVAGGVSENTAYHLAKAARSFANQRNFQVSGFTAPSSFNVDDMVGVGLLAKGGLKLLGGMAAKNVVLKEGNQLLLQASGVIHRHHVLPQQFKSWFGKQGIKNIDSYTIEISAQTHLRGVHGSGLGNLPGQWNKKWSEFIKTNPNASPSEIFHQAEGMLKQYGLEHLPYIPYKK